MIRLLLLAFTGSAVAAVPIWTDPERTPTLPLASGDGVLSTASSAAQLLSPGKGIYFGPREAREDWAQFARRYQAEADVAAWVRNESVRVARWSARKFERADLVGGWNMAYIDARTGLPMSWAPESPEPPNGTSAAEKSFKGAWVAWGRQYNITQAQTAARIYRLTGDAHYGQWAAQQLDFYAAHYRQWPLRTSEGRSTMYMQGLDEASDVFALLDTARLLDGLIDAERKRKWREGLFMPMARNLRATSAPMSNIALWHQSAIAAIAMRLGDTALLDEAINGGGGIKAQMAYGLSADNFWIEGTFAYNYYVLEVISKLLVQASLEGHAARFTLLREQAVRLLLAGLDYRFDNNTLPNPNDSRGAQPLIFPLAHWRLYRVAPTYWGLDASSKWATWEFLLDPPAAVPASEPALPPLMTRNFPALRQAVLRSGPWQVFVHYGQSNGNHVQEELTTFELHHGTTPIAVDPGTVDYSSPYHKGYFAKGPANNVPLIDGVGQSHWAPGNLLNFEPDANRLVVEQPKYQPDVGVTRGYRVTREGFAEQTSIAISKGAPRRLGLVFNTACKIRLLQGTRASVVNMPPPPVSATSYWKNISQHEGQASWRAELNCGAGARYSMTVSGPPGQRIYLATAPNTPMPAERNTLYYEVQGSSARFESEIRALP